MLSIIQCCFIILLTVFQFLSLTLVALKWFGENTPGKRKTCSDIWKYVKRQKPGNPLEKEGNTHICVASIPEDDFGGRICIYPLKFYNRSKGANSSSITTRALEHMAKYHKGTQLSKDYDDRADAAHRAKVKPQLRNVVSLVCISFQFVMFPPTLSCISCILHIIGY